MSERPAQRPPTSGGAAAGGPATDEVVVRAGCGRTRGVSAAEVARAGASSAAFAYLALDYPECPTCPHRVDPEGAASFCAWRPVDAPHPFAALAGWEAPT